MAYFQLPQWVIRRIDSIRRTFLWGRNDETRSAISLINWRTVCLPKRWGGVGVADLKLRNISLLLRRWWRAYTQLNTLWTDVILMLKSVRTGGPKFWIVGGSFFWKALQAIRPFFIWSTYWQIGTGREISFWFDAWNGMPICTGRQKPEPYYISLAEASNRMATIQPLFTGTQVQFNQNLDQLAWRWEANGQYSSKSAYEAFISGGKVKWQFTSSWSLKVPATVKIFLFLLLKDKLLTHEVMHKQGFNCELTCATCNTAIMESAMHMVFTCPVAIRVWEQIASQLGLHIMHPHGTVQQTWMTSRDRARGAGMHSKTWGVFFAAVCWTLWKWRNKKLFEGKVMHPKVVAEVAIHDGLLWSTHC